MSPHNPDSGSRHYPQSLCIRPAPVRCLCCASRRCRHYPDDETDIPIDDVIRFYDELLNRYSGNEDRLREDIHEFAAKTVDMSVVMRPVVDFIKS